MALCYLAGITKRCGTDMLLPIALVLQFILFPYMPPIILGYFETEWECQDAVQFLEAKTNTPIILTCVVST